MEDKRSADAGSNPRAGENGEPQVDLGCKEFDELISSEHNVEYEEDRTLDTLSHPDLIGKLAGVKPEGFSTLTGTESPGELISIPLQVKLGDGNSQDYLLKLSVSLEKVDTGVGTTWGLSPSGDEAEEEPGLEIDILDGRTSLVYNESEDPEEGEDLQPDAAERQGWFRRLFSFRTPRE